MSQDPIRDPSSKALIYPPDSDYQQLLERFEKLKAHTVRLAELVAKVAESNVNLHQRVNELENKLQRNK